MLIAVKGLSPVTITLLIPASDSLLIIEEDIGLILFSIIKNPLKFNLFSIVSLGIFTISGYFDLIFLDAKASILNPCYA